MPPVSNHSPWLKPKKGFLVLIFLLSMPGIAYSEYRAYLIEVYDHIARTGWQVRTGFSPDKYVQTHGGGNRLSVFTMATWMCYGSTGGYEPVCPMPDPIEPRFGVGDRVRVNLEKHLTQGWVGIVELAYYQKSVHSNVYGVRFGDKRQMYNRYFEFNLEKVTQPTAGPAANSPETPQTTP